MSDLTGRAIKDTYKDLLQVSNNNAGVDGTLRNVSDGEGTSSAIQLSETQLKVNGDLHVTGEILGAPIAEVFGFSKNADGDLIVTTTNGGQENISAEQFDSFDEVVFGSTGFEFSLTSNGNLMATITG